MFGTKLRRTLAVVGVSALAAVAFPLIASAPAAGAPGDPVIVLEPTTAGCFGDRPTPGSMNTQKILIGGTLVPGGTAIFQITFPFTPVDQG
ncbi:MAG: hypothetical protein ABI808_06425, partial [Pseudonocardiales bacterium]